MEGKRLFSKDHVWVLQTGDTAKLGVSDYAQEKLGSVVFLNLPNVGENLSIGQRFGDIESIKTVSDLISPLDGKVTAVNDELADELDAVNEAPYESWFIKVEIKAMSDELMDEDAYREYMDKL